MRTPLNERNLNLFQLEWKSKTLCRLYFNGDVKERIFRREFNRNKRNIFLTICNMECRVDNVLFRSMFAHSVFEARRMASSGMVLLNGNEIKRPGLQLTEGDVLQIKPSRAYESYLKSHHPMIRLWSFIPNYLEVNFPTLSTVLLHKPMFDQIPNPYPRYMIDNTSAFYSKRC